MKQKFAHIYHLLVSYQPSSSAELYDKQKMLELIERVPDCFERTCRLGHFTASAFLLNKAMTHACLLHHAKLKKWLQPGGHADGDSDLLSVAIKEAQEETGIQEIKPIMTQIFDIDIHLIPDSAKEAAHYHFDVRFLLHAYGDDTFIKNHESLGLCWVPKHDYHNSVAAGNQSLLRMFNTWHAMKL